MNRNNVSLHVVHSAARGPSATARDPVCGMTVDLSADKPSQDYNGTIYHFCSERCHKKFSGDPDRFISGTHQEPRKSAPKGTKYTCPMHPQVIRDEPGSCPICGMALEPMGVVSPDEGPNPELVDFTQRFWIGTALTVPLLILTMSPLLGITAVRGVFGERATLWIELASRPLAPTARSGSGARRLLAPTSRRRSIS